MKNAGLFLAITGGAILLAGLLLLLMARLPWAGRLPGDVRLHGKNWSFSFPLVSCLLVSLLLTVLVNVILRIFRK